MSTKWAIGTKLVHRDGQEYVFGQKNIQKVWEAAGWRTVEPPAPVERKLAAGWMKYTPRPNYRECWEIGCSKDAGYAKSIEGCSRMCEEHAGKAGAFAGAPVTETTKCPTADRRPGYSCDCPTMCTPPPVVEKAKPLTCIRFECERADATVSMRIMRKDAAPEPICAECYVAADRAMSKVMVSRPKPRPAAHPGVVAQVVGPFVGILGARGMRAGR